MKLEAVAIKATSARMEWRHLDEQEEKPHVDGVQVEILDLEPILIKKIPSSSFVGSNWTREESLYLTYLR